MIAINNLVPLDFNFKESDFEIALMEALASQMIKYDTTVSLEQNVYSFAPLLMKDAILASGCAVVEGCEVPEVLINSVIQMAQACKICLTNLSDAERKMYGIELSDPKPTTVLENRKAKEQALALTLSLLKTYWIGSTFMSPVDLNNPALLPAYRKDNGQWTKIAGIPDVPHFIIAKNALTTPTAQVALTASDALDIIDGMFLLQSQSLQMIPDSSKFIWVTNEIYDAVKIEFSRKAIAGIAFQTIESEFGIVDTFTYRDAQVIKYQHLSTAIRDLATGENGVWQLPNRAIMTITLPQLSFQKPTEQTFATQFYEVTKSWEAGTIATVLHPDPVQKDYYVVAY
jgi:hypothetical protein